MYGPRIRQRDVSLRRQIGVFPETIKLHKLLTITKQIIHIVSVMLAPFLTRLKIQAFDITNLRQDRRLGAMRGIVLTLLRMGFFEELQAGQKGDVAVRLFIRSYT